ncbi:MAG TPA: S41 family peptidase [Candidatus Obscuribacterales bacterium]
MKTFKLALAMLLAFTLGLNLPGVRAANFSQGFAALLQSLQLIRTQALDSPDELALMRGATRGLVKALADPYSSYLEPDDFQALKAEESGQVVGVGLELAYRQQQVLVMSVLDQTPAEAAGLQPGDRILAIDGQSADQLSWPEILRQMQGLPGQSLNLSVQSHGHLRKLTLVRQILNLQALSFRRLTADICQLRIRTFFNENLHQQVSERLAQSLGDCSGGLILDLRNNPGGLLTEALSLAGQLGIQGTVVQIVSREGRVQTEATQSEALLLDTLPLLVLINGGTASAAEVLAAALQESGRAQLMGETSFGKGLVQSLLPLSDGSGLSLTTHRYLTLKGKNLHQAGIVPDIPAQDPEHLLEQAQAYLQSPP